ncbi:MAG: OmpA family protein [Pseudomonadota bacterium]|nr:OmpA family protein [Pseudomonadota bacterium]
MQRLRRIGLALGAAGLAATAVAPAVAQSADVWVNPEFLGGGAGTPGGAAGPLVISPGPERYRLPFNRPADDRITLRPPGSPRTPAPAPAGKVAAPVKSAPPVAAAPKLTPPTPPVTSAPVAAAPVTVRPAPPPNPAPAEAAPRIPVIGPSTRTPAPPAPATTPATTAPKIDLPVVAAKPSAPATVEAPSAAPTPPAAPPPATTAAPRAVAPSTDWAAATTAPASDLRIAFAGKAEEPDAAAAERIRAIAADLARTDDRLKISAYAAAGDETTDWARRVSLRRAMNVRQLLLDGGVQSFRIQVRALGTPSDGGPGNRVDLDIEKR